MIVYTHIAKTAGTTMLHWLEGQCKTYHLQRWWMSKWLVPEDTECLFSHCPYGLPDRYVPGDHQYVTFLRNPIDRIVSNYFHVVNNPNNLLLPGYTSMPFDELIKGEIFATFDNGITRIISGRPDMGNLPPKSPATREDLEKAKANIATFAMVGFVETFNWDLARLAAKFGWSDLSYTWYRKGSRPKLTSIKPEILQQIAQYNQLDIELVEHAKKIWHPWVE
jgi:hypothetical protein